jgi:hypothetical protein
LRPLAIYLGPFLPAVTGAILCFAALLLLRVDRAKRILYASVVVAASVTITILYAFGRGQDFNFDQRNYHIGIPFLLAHGTFWESVAPAGIQSYFNPYVLEIQFFAIRHLSGIGFGVTLAVVQSLAFIVAGLICADIAKLADRSQAAALGVLGFALSLLAPIALSEAGTTLIDLITAVPVLAAYALLLVRGRLFSPLASATLAGALLGTATALKLTNAVFALGVVGFALAGPDGPRKRIVWLLACTVAAILAFAVVGGPWHLALWRRFGNPFFPFYNDIFRSPDFPPTAIHDERFLPHSFLAIWRYPLYWLLGGSPTPGISSPSSEAFFRDARWIIAVLGITFFLGAFLTFWSWARERLKEPATGLLFAFTIGYLVWLFEFGYQRYATSLDILCGAVLLSLAMALPAKRLRLPILLAIVLVSGSTMVVPKWWHLPWRPYWQSINPQPLHFGGPSIVFLTVKPSLFIAASLPPDTRYVGIGRYVSIDGELDLRAGNNTELTRQLKQELSSTMHFQLKEADQGTVPAVSAAILASYGLFVTDRCQPLHIAVESFRICDVATRP